MLQPKEYRSVPTVDYCSWILGNNSYDHDKAIYIDAHKPSHTLSYNQARSIVRKLIAGFRARGIKPGDSVCVHSFNNIYYTLLYLAIVGSGGVFVGTNPSYTPVELTHFFTISSVRFIIAEPELLHNIHVSTKQCSIPDDRLFTFDTHRESPPVDGKEASRPTKDGRHESWEALLNYGEEDWISFDDEETAKSTPAALMSTSGTTGLPKAAIISHYAHVAQNVMLYDSDKKPYEIRRLCCLPQFHAFAGPLNNYAPLREGYPTYVMRRFNLPQYLEYIETYQINETHMVNPILLSILSLTPAKQKMLDSVRAVWIGGAPLDGKVQNRLGEVLHGDARICQVYGMTEIGWITTFHYPERDGTGSAGRLVYGIEAKIVDDSGNARTEDHVQGEVVLRGPSLMNGYLGNDKATAETIVDGWLHTGDIGYQVDGKLYICDRVKDIIKVRGWQVSPAEIEATLLTHPKIEDCAVIGVDFGDGKGELPRAYVMTKKEDAEEVTDEEIFEWVKGRLSRFKQLAGGIKRVESIPRGASGKILKRMFKEQAKKEVDDMTKEAVKANGGSSGKTNSDEKEIGTVDGCYGLDKRRRATNEADGESPLKRHKLRDTGAREQMN